MHRDEAARAMLDHALWRGWIDRFAVERAAQQPGADLASIISELTPSHARAELQQVYARALAAPGRSGGETVLAGPGRAGVGVVPVLDSESRRNASRQRIGGYQVVGELGRGGMGVVYKGRHPELGREVAIKVLNAGEQASAKQLERFRLEAHAVARLRHENIVAVHDVGVDEGLAFMVMDLVRGESLEKRLERDGPLEPREVARVGELLARALQHAHEHSILHRDLKPANVLLDDAGKPWVTDFGLAKVMNEDGPAMTVSGQLVGTPAFMPPEQASGGCAYVDARADVYSLGATLYALLTGRAPFEHSSLMALLAAIHGTDPEPPSRVRPGIDRDLETIVLTCLERAPARRYASAAALADDLGRWLAGEAISARPPGLVDRVRRWGRRNRAAALLCGAALALVTTGAFGALVVVPRRAEALARADRELAGAQRAAAAHAFVVALDQERATAEQALPGVGAEPTSLRAALDAFARADDAVAAAWAGLPPEVRAHVPASSAPASLERDVLAARAFSAHARALADDEPSRADEAWAEAYRLAPASPVGCDAICEVAVRREGAGPEAVLDHLLDAARPLSPVVRARALAARARRRIGAFDLPGAAADLAALRALDKATAAPLDEFVRPMLRQVELASPTVRVARAQEGVAGARAALEVGYDDGSGAVLRLEPAPAPRLVPAYRLAAITDLAPGERIGRVAFGGSERAPLAAAFTSSGRLLLAREDGRVFARINRTSRNCIALEFVELDDDPTTTHLVLLLGPNAGDSLLVRLDPVGMTALELDLPGRIAPGTAATACFLSACVAGRLEGKPTLLLAYGTQAANHLKLLRLGSDGVAVPVGPPVEVGYVAVARIMRLPGRDAPEVVALHQRREEPTKPRWTPAGLAVYSVANGAVVAPPREARPGCEPFALTDGMHVLRLDGRAFALWSDRPFDGEARLRLASLDPGGGLLVDVQLHERSPWRDVLCALDPLGDGRDVLVMRAEGGLRLLGLPDATARVADPPPSRTPLAPEVARALATGHLADLGFRRQALAAVAAREDAAGVTPESEALGLDLLEEAERAPARADDAFLELAERFATRPGRSAPARARVLVLRAERLARAGDPDADRRALAELEQLPRGLELPPAVVDARERLRRVLALRNAPATHEVRFGAAPPPRGLLASNPCRVRLVRGRGLSLAVSRRVPLVAGALVEVRPGPVRVRALFEVHGRTWNASVEVGLFRPHAAGASRQRRVEGLTLGRGPCRTPWRRGSAGRSSSPPTVTSDLSACTRGSAIRARCGAGWR